MKYDIEKIKEIVRLTPDIQFVYFWKPVQNASLMTEA